MLNGFCTHFVSDANAIMYRHRYRYCPVETDLAIAIPVSLCGNEALALTLPLTLCVNNAMLWDSPKRYENAAWNSYVKKAAWNSYVKKPSWIWGGGGTASHIFKAAYMALMH